MMLPETPAELIAEERPWKKTSGKIPKTLTNEKQRFENSENMDPGSVNMTEFSQNQLLSVRIKYGEAEPGRLVKAAGSRWNREKKSGNLLTGMWRLPDCRTELFK